jgi:hypothetical protein
VEGRQTAYNDSLELVVYHARISRWLDRGRLAREGLCQLGRYVLVGQLSRVNDWQSSKHSL